MLSCYFEEMQKKNNNNNKTHNFIIVCFRFVKFVLFWLFIKKSNIPLLWMNLIDKLGMIARTELYFLFRFSNSCIVPSRWFQSQELCGAVFLVLLQ